MTSTPRSAPAAGAAPPRGLWHRRPGLAYLAVFLGVAGHASSEFVAKVVANETAIAGPEVSVWRFLLGGLGLVVLALLVPGQRNLLTPLRRDGRRLLPLALLGVTGAYLLFHWSLDYATVAQVATMVTTAPIFVGVLNLLVNKQPLSGPKIVSGLGALAGVALLVTDGVLARLAGDVGSLFGVLLALGCAFLLSVYLILIKPYIARYGAMRIAAVTMFPGGLGLWLLVGLAWGDWVNPAALGAFEPAGAGAILVLALYNTTLTQFLWVGGLAAVPDITRGMYLFFLKPAVAALLALAVLGTVPTGWQVLAIVAITLCVGLEASWDKVQGALGRRRS
jgi:drug/metabolite transporter (DMT)-like permease